MGAQTPPMMAGFQAEENLTGRAKKMCEKLWTLSRSEADAKIDHRAGGEMKGSEGDHLQFR